MRTVKGHAKDGSLVMMILPLKLKPGDLDRDPYIMLKWNLWTLHGAVHDKRMQVDSRRQEQAWDTFVQAGTCTATTTKLGAPSAPD